MTREEARKILPVLQAFADGKPMQYKSEPTDDWTDLSDDLTPGLLTTYKYRVKSKDKCHPFNSKEECFEEMEEHIPFGWIKDSDSIYSITIIDKEGIYISDWENNIEFYSFIHALDVFTFADGKPFGFID